MKLYVVRDQKKIDISDQVGKIAWEDSIDTLGQQMSFGYSGDELNLGDYFILTKDNEIIFQGIATDKDKTYNPNTMIVHDFAWYLNKSEEIIQFNKISSNKAIKQLLDKYNVKLGRLDATSIIISRIYKDKKVSEVIKDVLSIVSAKTGEKFRLEMRNNQLYIEKYSDIQLNPLHKPAVNLAPFDVRKAIDKGFSYSESINDLKNAILIVSDEEKSASIIAKASDQESISKYGLMQQVESVDNENLPAAKKIAKEKLRNLNRKEIDISIIVPGDVNLKSGRYLEISNDYFSGIYLIKNTSHSYDQGIYKTSMTLGDDKYDNMG